MKRIRMRATSLIVMLGLLCSVITPDVFAYRVNAADRQADPFYAESVKETQVEKLYAQATGQGQEVEEEVTDPPSSTTDPANPVPTTVPPQIADIELSDPVIENESTKWDTIYFGNYWQTDTNGDGMADQNDDKTPIKWRVLEVDGMEALLLSDLCLDTQPYSDKTSFTSWAKSYLRNWLNTSFYDEAFSREERAAILSSQVNNNGNVEQYAKDGDNTVDKVYLLSVEEIKNEKYGFDANIKKYVESRVAYNTEYARSKEGAWNSGSDNRATWFLRTPAAYYFVPLVSTVTELGQGAVFDGMHTPNTKSSVRPVIRVDLSNSNLWRYDKVFANGDITVNTLPKDSITDEQLFRDYPEYLDKSQQEKVMGEILDDCAEVNGDRTYWENVGASFKYLMDDFNGIKVGAKWYMNKAFGTTSISDEYLDELTLEFLEEVCREPSKIEKGFKKAKSWYKKLSEVKGGIKDANEAEIIMLLSKSKIYKEDTINKVASEMMKGWKKIDGAFKKAGVAVDFAEALSYVVIMEGIQKELVGNLLQEARKNAPDSTLCHGLQRAYDKLQQPELTIADKYIKKEGFKLLTDQLEMMAKKDIASFLGVLFGESAASAGGLVTVANLICTGFSRLAPGADADEVIKAQMNTTLFHELDRILLKKQTLFVVRKRDNGELDFQTEMSNYRLLYEARLTAAKKACEAVEKIAKKDMIKNIKKDKKLLEKFSYKKHIAGCKAVVSSVLEAQYTYKKDGSDLSIAGTVPNGSGGSGNIRIRQYQKTARTSDESLTIASEETIAETMDNILIVPVRVEGRNVTSIAEKAFQDNSEIEIAIIPDGITEIGQSAFQNCTSLQRVYVGKDVKSVAANAFAGCSSLNYVEFKGTVSVVGENIFNQSDLMIVSPENELVEQLARDQGFSCKIIDKEISKIEISKFPDKLCYKTEEDLDEEGMELTVTYVDDSEEIITSGWSSIGFSEGPGETVIQVFYGGQRTEYSIVVEEGEAEYTIYCIDQMGMELAVMKKKGCFAEKIKVDPPQIDGYDCMDECADIVPDFTGKEVTFIYKKNIENNVADAVVDLDQIFYEYTGSEIEPVPTVSLNGNSLLSGTDYEIQYRNNLDTGTAVIYIFGIGDYYGLKTAEFSITEKSEDTEGNTTDKKDENNSSDSSSTVEDKDYSSDSSPSDEYYNNHDSQTESTVSRNTPKIPGKIKGLSVKSKKKKKVHVRWKKVDGAMGYQLQYALSKKKLNKGKRKNTKKTSMTIKKLKKKKTYYVRVRTYVVVGNRNVYGKWSAVKRVKIKK